MRDNYGREIDYMRISITDRCNLRCRYCMPDGIDLVPMKDILTYEEIEVIARAAVRTGIRKFKVTGGEPLVRKDCAKLIGKLKSVPGIEQVTLTTNGVLLKECLPELLENGLDAVNISLDTMDRERYKQITGRDELSRVFAGIDAAVESGIPVKLNCVLQKDMNEDEAINLAELTLSRKMDVRFIEMMPIGSGKRYEPIYNEDIQKKLQSVHSGICRDMRNHGNGPAIYLKIPGAQGSVGFISAIHGKFCKDCNRIRLSAQGKLKPCLCYGQTVDLAGIVKKMNLADEESVAQTVRLLEQQIREAIYMKPESHRFENLAEITEEKRMIAIGG